VLVLNPVVGGSDVQAPYVEHRIIPGFALELILWRTFECSNGCRLAAGCAQLRNRESLRADRSNDRVHGLFLLA
jgi:hypothetical protein